MGVNFNPAGRNAYVNKVNSQQNQNNDVKEPQTNNAQNVERVSVKEGKLVGLEILGDYNRVGVGNNNQVKAQQAYHNQTGKYKYPGEMYEAYERGEIPANSYMYEVCDDGSVWFMWIDEKGEGHGVDISNGG